MRRPPDAEVRVGFCLAATKTHRLKPVLLKASTQFAYVGF
jgi:hypothetical protein